MTPPTHDFHKLMLKARELSKACFLMKDQQYLMASIEDALKAGEILQELEAQHKDLRAAVKTAVVVLLRISSEMGRQLAFEDQPFTMEQLESMAWHRGEGKQI